MKMVSHLLLEVRYEWSKFGTAAFVFPGHPYQFVSMAGYLYFSEVQPTDSKQYFCFVTLAAPNNYKLTTRQPPMKVSLGIWLMISEDSEYLMISCYDNMLIQYFVIFQSCKSGNFR